MPSLLRVVSRLPIPTETRLRWQRSLLDAAYVKGIAEARRLKDAKKVESLEWDRRLEIEVHQEDEDAYITQKVLRKARRLRISIPHLYNEDGSDSEHWYQGHHTGRRYLTTKGETTLREEIRKEVKARHEARSHWVAWVSALTGLAGALTGLVALLTRKPP